MKNRIMYCICSMLMCLQLTKAQTFYVAPAGNDKNAGTLEKPFATIERAKEAVKNYKKNKPATVKEIKVWVRGGVYQVAKTVVLGKEDGGDSTYSVIYKAYNGEKPIFSAANSVPAKLWKPLAKDSRKRVHPKVNPNVLVELDASALGLKNVFQFAPGNIFTTDWYIIDLFANGTRQPLSQYPNPKENIRGKNDPGWITCNGSKNNMSFYYGANGNPDDKDTANELDANGMNRAERWFNALNSGHEIWLKGLWRVPWEPFTMKVSDINLQDQSIAFHVQPPSGMGSKYSAVANTQPLWRKGTGKEAYFALNLLEEIDEPGEWALDTKDGKIYYYPPTAIDKLQVTVNDFSEAIFKINEASYLQIEGLGFEGTQGNALELNNAQQVQIAGCSIRNIGKTGIVMNGGSNNLLESNNIFDIGGLGIDLKNLGDRKTLRSSGVVVNNNYIHHVGNIIYRQAISISNSVGVTISHNLMHDIPTGSIRSDNINNCIIEYNEIHNIALKEGDTGVFYNYGGWSTYGNIFRYNFSHHTARANGFYSDDGDSGDFYYKNIVQGCQSGVLFGGGHDNLAEHNLFVESKKQSVDDRGKDRNYRLGTKYETNLKQFKTTESPWKEYGETLVQQHQLSTQLWSDVLNIDWHPELPNGCRMQNNVAVASGKFMAQTGQVTVKDNVAIEKLSDAGFYNYAQMDLRTNNATILSKFPELNEVFPKIGLVKNSYRTQIPDRAQTGGLKNRIQAEVDSEDKMVDKVKPAKG